MVRMFFLIAMLALPWASWADVYTVENVSATVATRAGATMPREKALEQAIHDGFIQLLRQLTPQSSWSRHAWLLSEMSPDAALDKVTIVSENTTDQYTLVANLSFKRDMVRKLLAQHGIPFSETENATVLVIPIYEVGAAKVLWDETNPWRKALRKAMVRQGPLTFTLPAGDVTEISRLTPQMAIAGAQDALLALAKSYNAKAVVVARAQLDQRGSNGRLLLRGQWYKADENRALPMVTTSFPLPVMGVNEDVLAQAATKLYQQLEAAWQQTGMVAADKPASVYFRYPATSPKDAAVFEKQMSDMAAVFNIKHRLISRAETVYEVNYFGDFTALQTQIQGLGYRMSREGHLWRIHKVQTPS